MIKLRERRGGRLYFGERDRERWSIADPADQELIEAMRRMLHGPTPTAREQHLVLAAADAYRHLCCYPLADVAVRKLRDVRRAIRRA